MKCPACQTENPTDSKYCRECATSLPPSGGDSVSPTKTIEAPKEELTTGATIAGRYQIIEELGKGGMGRVYKVLDKEVNAKVALKLIKAEIAADKHTIERFRNELKTARDISHKNVCRMYDLNKEAGTYYLTMEYVPGEDLKSMIRMSGQLGVGTAISIAKQVCEGLAEAHRLGVIHRDLKPSNIMIDREGHVRIMDFGIARSLKAKGITGAGVMIGTPEYMSPEQVEGKDVDQRSDIYSLGAILYEMMTGRVPFEGDTPFTIGVKHKSEIPKDPKVFNPHLPDDLSRVIIKCLEKDKEKRYQNSEELRSELTRIEKGIPTTEREIPRRKPLTSREITVTFGLKKLFLPAFVFVALVITAVVVWRFLPRKQAVHGPKIENSIAVISFENQTGDEAYDYLQKAIPNLLITSLEQTGDLYVVTWERMQDLLGQMGKKDVESVDRDLGFKLCRMEGVEAVVLGSYIKAENTFATDVKVLDVETKRLLKSASSRGEGVSSILKAQIDELSRSISEGIGLAREKIELQKLHIADVTTTSMEAYKHYMKGVENIRKFYHEEAMKDLEKAVEIDPDFASAHSYLSSSYGWLGNTEARNRAIEKAKACSQKATEKEKLWIEARYAWIIERDRGKNLNIIQQLAEKYPKDKEPYFSLGIIYRDEKDYDKALEAFHKALDLDPDYGEAHNEIGYTYLDMGNHEKSIGHFEKYASLNPGDANPLDSLAEAYFLLGRLDEAVGKYKEALEVKPDYYDTYFKIGYVFALKEDYAGAFDWIEKCLAMSPPAGYRQDVYLWKGFYHFWLGNIDQCFIDFQIAGEIAEAQGNEGVKAVMDRLRAFVLYYRSNLELSRKYEESWLNAYLKVYPKAENYYKALHSSFLGLLELAEGRTHSAIERLAEAESFSTGLTPSQKEWTTPINKFLQAGIWIQEGHADKAVAVFDKIQLPVFPALQYTGSVISYHLLLERDIKARAYQHKGDFNKAMGEYERLITFDPKSKEKFLVFPLYHYRLAKLYEQKAQKGKAIGQYSKFLELWKEANPDLPEVEDARKRLASLR